MSFADFEKALKTPAIRLAAGGIEYSGGARAP
jgi:hypothetical protein